MLLNLFGECSIVAEREEPVTTNRIQVNWELLPQGKYPWKDIRNKIDEISQKQNKTQKQMMLHNCEVINELSPDFIAYGRSGFRGYAVFGFVSMNLYVLESVFPNNATYIFENDWEELSKMTKAQILMGNLQKARIIHSTNWQREFKKIMGVS